MLRKKGFLNSEGAELETFFLTKSNNFTLRERNLFPFDVKKFGASF